METSVKWTTTFLVSLEQPIWLYMPYPNIVQTFKGLANAALLQKVISYLNRQTTNEDIETVMKKIF